MNDGCGVGGHHEFDEDGFDAGTGFGFEIEDHRNEGVLEVMRGDYGLGIGASPSTDVVETLVTLALGMGDLRREDGKV